MSDIKKVLCFCGSGLGTSFMMEMNAKKALKSLGITDVEVDHTTIDDMFRELRICLFVGLICCQMQKRQGKQLDLITWFQWKR